MKRNLLALFAIVLAIAFTAFTSKETKKSDGSMFAKKWYIYNGTGAQNTAASYGSPSSTEPDCPFAVRLCAIFVEEDPTTPGIPLQSALNTLLTQHGNGSQFTAEVEDVIEFKQ